MPESAPDVTDLETDVVDALRLGLSSKTDIANRVNQDPEVVIDALLRLERRRVVERSEGNGTARWALTPEGHRRPR